MHLQKEQKCGKLNDGRIKSNGNIYEVKFLEGGTAEVWRNGEGTNEFRETGGSPITNSEMRRAMRLNGPGIIKV